MSSHPTTKAGVPAPPTGRARDAALSYKSGASGHWTAVADRPESPLSKNLPAMRGLRLLQGRPTRSRDSGQVRSACRKGLYLQLGTRPGLCNRETLLANTPPHRSTGPAEGEGMRRGFHTNPSLRPSLASMPRYMECCWYPQTPATAMCSCVGAANSPLYAPRHCLHQRMQVGSSQANATRQTRACRP